MDSVIESMRKASKLGNNMDICKVKFWVFLQFTAKNN